MILYFLNAVNDDPSELGNWFEDSGGSSPASSLPTSSDDCYIVGTCSNSGFSFNSLSVLSSGSLVYNSFTIVTSNEGTIDYNQGSIAYNAGTVVFNVGQIDNNVGTVTDNQGNVINAGTVTSNSVTVTNISGTVVTNTFSGTVSLFGGSVTTNDGLIILQVSVANGSGNVSSASTLNLSGMTATGPFSPPPAPRIWW